MTISHSKSHSFELFNDIAGRYDFINSVLSMGLHAQWRKHIRARLPSRPGLRVLDLATGTADVALEMIKSPKVDEVVGVDMSREMLKLGDKKIAEKGLEKKITLKHGDAQNLEEADCSFDAVSMSFGIRNVADVSACMREAYRVLKPGGRFLVLEFSLPKSKALRASYLFYLRNVLPKIGKILSGHDVAYKYLNETIEEFPYGERFVNLLQEAGFEDCGFKKLAMGTVNLYWSDKR